MGYYEELLERAVKEGTAHRITTAMVKLEVDKPLVGRYLGRELIKSTKRNRPDFYRYGLDTSTGPITFLASGAFDKMTGDKLEAGKVYSITYKGKVDISGGRSMKVIEALHLPEPGEETEGEAGEEAED